MSRKLLMVVEVDDFTYEWQMGRYGDKPDKIAVAVADDLLSASGEYLGPNLIKAEWIEGEPNE